MRKILKVNYIILILGVFVVVYRQAFIQLHNKFYSEEGKIVLSGESEEERYLDNKNLFFYEAKGLHQKEPFYETENDTLKLEIYEVSYPDHSKKDIHRVVTYLMPIITFKEEIILDPDTTYGIYFASLEDDDINLNPDDYDEDEEAYWFQIFNFLDLDVYLADTGYGDIIPAITEKKIDLLLKDPIRIEIFTAEIKEDDGEKLHINRLLTSSINITENSFEVRNTLINLFHNKEVEGQSLDITEEDVESLKEVGVFMTVRHDAAKYIGVVFLWFGIYFLIVLVSGYFVFFFKKDRKLGRVKPSKALKESIEEGNLKNK